MPVSFEVDGHPLGVKPGGEAIFSGSDCRKTSLGSLRVVDDTTLLQILQCLDGESLATLSAVSLYAYVWGNYQDLWKRLTLQISSEKPYHGLFSHPPERLLPVVESAGKGTNARRCTWRDCYLWLRVQSSPSSQAEKEARWLSLTNLHSRAEPIRARHVYSDLLYHSHLLCGLTGLPERWICVDNVDKRQASHLSVEDFVRDYERPNRPVVIHNCPFFHRQARQGLPSSLALRDLLQRFGDRSIHASGYTMTLADYVAYARSTALVDEAPLYIFDKGFAQTLCPLADEYSTPPYFAEDLFSCLEACKQARPDYRWLIAGPGRSGSSFHIDPNSTSAWNICLSGTKKWIMFPPGTIPPGVHPASDGSELATPLTPLEWFINFYDEAMRSPFNERPLETITRPGEVMFVPRGWWHMVFNMSEGVAVTQNYVSSQTLPWVLHFLETQPHNISGCPIEDRPHLPARFTHALELHQPALLQTATSQVGCVDSSIQPGTGSRRSNKKTVPREAKKRQLASVFAEHRTSYSSTQKKTKIEPSSSEAGGNSNNQNGAFSFGFTFP